MSGKFGVKTGIESSPGQLILGHSSVYTELEAENPGIYSNSFFGKWHLSQPTDPNHPNDHGIDHFEGFMGSDVGNYFSWGKATNGATSTVNEYATTHLTTGLKDWIASVNVYDLTDGTLDGTVQNTDFDAWSENKAKIGLSIF